MQNNSQEQFNKAEKEYIEAKLRLVEVKHTYEIVKAKTRQFLRATYKNDKPTLQDIEDKLLEIEDTIGSELQIAYLTFISSSAEKERKRVDMDTKSRIYWDDKKI